MWTWNPPGYGRSGGRASLSGIADAAIDFWNQVLQREAGPSTSVWLCGNSLGCATTLRVAAAVQPDPSKSGIVLRNPPPLGPVVKRVAQRYPLSSLVSPIAESVCDSMNVLLSAREVHLPAVFFQSELDTLVPVAFQNQVVEAYAGESRVVLMEGLSHGGVATEFHKPMIEESIRWLWEQTGCKTDEPYQRLLNRTRLAEARFVPSLPAMRTHSISHGSTTNTWMRVARPSTRSTGRPSRFTSCYELKSRRAGTLPSRRKQ